MTELTFRIPWQHLCSDNRKLVALGVLSPQYRAAKEAVGMLSLAQARKARWKVPQGRLGMEVTITEPDHRKRDHLNFAKGLCDGITSGGGVWIDDSQVRDARWLFANTVDKENAGATVRVWTLAKGES